MCHDLSVMCLFIIIMIQQMGKISMTERQSREVQQIVQNYKIVYIYESLGESCVVHMQAGQTMRQVEDHQGPQNRTHNTCSSGR